MQLLLSCLIILVLYMATYLQRVICVILPILSLASVIAGVHGCLLLKYKIKFIPYAITVEFILK